MTLLVRNPESISSFSGALASSRETTMSPWGIASQYAVTAAYIDLLLSIFTELVAGKA
jgi:hypothetical protein